MDKTAREIVRLLEEDARLSFAALGQKVGLSKTPWLAAGPGARAPRPDPRLPDRARRRAAWSQGPCLRARDHPIHPLRGVRGGRRKPPLGAQCCTTAGQADYLMHVLVGKILQLDELLRMEINRMPGVQKIETTVCMKTIKPRAPLTGCLRA